MSLKIERFSAQTLCLSTSGRTGIRLRLLWDGLMAESVSEADVKVAEILSSCASNKSRMQMTEAITLSCTTAFHDARSAAHASGAHCIRKSEVDMRILESNKRVQTNF
jgi:hypothetical protein